MLSSLLSVPKEFWGSKTKQGLKHPSPGIGYPPPGLISHKSQSAKSLQSCPTLCDPIDFGSPPGSPVPGILQARTLEWVAISFSNSSKWKVKVKSLSRVRLSDPMDCSLPGSSVHGIFQARVLEWGATEFQERRRQPCAQLLSRNALPLPPPRVHDPWVSLSHN